MASLCHPWFTTTNLSYRFPIFETSATALCGTTGTKEEHLTSKLVDFDQCVGVQLDPYAQSKRISDYKIQGLFLSQTQCFICFITIHHLVLYIWRSCAPGRILLANPKASTRFQLRDWPRPQELGTQRACPDGQVQFAQSESGQGWLMPIQRGVSHWLFTKFP